MIVDPRSSNDARRLSCSRLTPSLIGSIAIWIEAWNGCSRCCEFPRSRPTLPTKTSAAAQQSISAATDAPLRAGLDRERTAFMEVFFSADAREGVDAFVEKRRAVFRHK